jgi:hypothetical protein
MNIQGSLGFKFKGFSMCRIHLMKMVPVVGVEVVGLVLLLAGRNLACCHHPAVPQVATMRMATAVVRV